MNTQGTKIIVVLGMHRSGTSAITRGLSALGVELGDDSYAVGIDNPKGFWEDKDCLMLNERLLEHLGSSYDGLLLPTNLAASITIDAELGLIFREAVEVIRGKVTQLELYGFKDPRTARLLPFWKEVFNRVGCSPYYLIALRNPLSVARSLYVRNGIDAEKSHFLWLDHMLSAVIESKGSPRIVVDYDNLLDNPRRELVRIARAFGLSVPVGDGDIVREFSEQFLDGALRHTRYTPGDLQRDTCVPRDVVRLYEMLRGIAADDGAIDSDQTNGFLQDLQARLNHFAPAFRYITRLETRCAERAAAISERDGAVATRDAAVAERDVAVAERDVAVAERDVAVAMRAAAVAERMAAVAAALAERDAALAERDAAAALIEQIRLSRSWRLTRPLRFVGRWARHGVSDDERQQIAQRLRQHHHLLPLPKALTMALSRAYRRMHRQVPQGQVLIEAPRSQQPGLPDYIIWGVIDWHFRHQRPQQLALSLGASGRRVFYVSAILLNRHEPGFECEKVHLGDQVFQVKLFASGAPSIYSTVPNLDVTTQLLHGIGDLLRWTRTRGLVSVVEHPFWTNVATVLPNSRVAYDCMDHHEGFGNTSPELTVLERGLAAKSNLTVTTSEWLDNIVATHSRRNAIIRNACEYDHFAVPPPDRYRDSHGRRIIGYYGAIAEWFDVDLVRTVADRFSQCCILLVGADTVGAQGRLSKSRNVVFTGEVSYDDLPYYLHAFDVCILPFSVVPLTLATNPVKAYEFLSAGKSIVSVDLPEMRQFGNLVRVASDTESFVAAVENALSIPPGSDEVSARQAFAREQTWTHRTKELIAAIESPVYDPIISVIVVTYNNLDLSKACLASLERFSDYPCLELIVVDNASSDGTLDYLAVWAGQGRNRQVIANSSNRGFAAANNQGLAVATGDYLVLLNNDTYVTPGWARTLMGHLQRDRRIGLIGPVTNNIGNEAKIDAAYDGMEEMLGWAADYTLAHIGRAFSIRTAAFFCVMMPRSTYASVGALDEAFGIGFFEDDDYCRRVEQSGLGIVCAEDVFVHHQLSASFNQVLDQDRQALYERNKAIYESKWGEWVPHIYRATGTDAQSMQDKQAARIFQGQRYFAGTCNICGASTRFFYQDPRLWRESLTCEHCRSTSRYRSIARGILRAVGELSRTHAKSLAQLPWVRGPRRLRVYDTQPPFYYDGCAYPIPDRLEASGWIDVELSQYRPKVGLGEKLSDRITNQNLECLTFAAESFDIVVTSDVMEHVRLDERAHREIFRVLGAGGIYLFTVPHDPTGDHTLVRVQVTDPNDPSGDVHLLEPEYHGDANSGEGAGALSYRVYGKDLEQFLTGVGFEVEYTREDFPEIGVMNAELFYCRKVG